MRVKRIQESRKKNREWDTTRGKICTMKKKTKNVNKVNWYVIFVVRRMQFQFISIYDNIQVGSNQPSIHPSIRPSIHLTIHFISLWYTVSNSLRFQYLFLNKWLTDVHTKTREYCNHCTVPQTRKRRHTHIHADKLRFQREQRHSRRRKK